MFDKGRGLMIHDPSRRRAGLGYSSALISPCSASSLNAIPLCCADSPVSLLTLTLGHRAEKSLMKEGDLLHLSEEQAERSVVHFEIFIVSPISPCLASGLRLILLWVTNVSSFSSVTNALYARIESCNERLDDCGGVYKYSSIVRNIRLCLRKYEYNPPRSPVKSHLTYTTLHLPFTRTSLHTSFTLDHILPLLHRCSQHVFLLQ